MANMDMKELMAHEHHKMQIKRNTLFRAFLINYVAVFIVWLITLTPFYGWAMATFTHFPPEAADLYVMNILGIWKVAGVILFLIPALAIWWEMAALKNRKY
ncbi:MAG: hypothetical protein FWC51_04015 [Proteobacteria bacterium]|nr:hypothetical protein [Pseudomonadota bacterium]